jgi:hypothetical protein
MTVARRQMTLRSCGLRACATSGDDLWHRRVLARIPIRRIEYVVNLRLECPVDSSALPGRRLAVRANRWRYRSGGVDHRWPRQG